MTTTDEHFGLLGAARDVRRAGRRRRARPGRDPRRGHAADAAARALAGALDDGRGPARARAARAQRRPDPRRRRPVRRRDPGRRGRARLPHDLGPEVALRAGLRPARSSSPTRSGCGSPAPSYFSQAGVRAGRRVRADGRARALRAGLVAAASLAGLLAALDSRPAWAFDRAAAVAERCRELPRGRVEVVTPEPSASTLVAFRARRRAGRARRGALRTPACTCARSRAPGSSASRVAGGRRTAISTGCSRRCRRERARAPARAAPSASRSTAPCAT